MVFIVTIANAQKIDTVEYDRTVFPPQATVALKYNYFLPVDVLGHQKQLGLTIDQVNKLKRIEATFQLKRTETNVSAKQNEHMLDSLFRTGRINEGVIIFYTNRYGLYEGEYRGAVLIACYNTRKVLTQAQLKKLIGIENHN